MHISFYPLYTRITNAIFSRNIYASLLLDLCRFNPIESRTPSHTPYDYDNDNNSKITRTVSLILLLRQQKIWLKQRSNKY